jgi:hypothetical protein
VATVTRMFRGIHGAGVRFALLVFVAVGLVVGTAPAVAEAASSVANTATPGGTPALSSRLLSTTEMPAGWQDTFVPTSEIFHGSCFQAARSALKKGWERTGFTNHKASFDEYLATTSKSAKLQSLRHNLATCKKFHYSLGKHTLTGVVKTLPLPTVGTASSAYTVGVVGNVVFTLVDDVVLFQAHTDLGVLVYVAVGQPNPTTVAALARMAAAKAEGQPISAPGTSGTTTTS